MKRAGFVLVGGKSTRMGRDKAMLPFHGRTLVEHVAATVEAAAGSVTLVGAPDIYEGFGYRVVPDRYPDSGPAAGIHAALLASAADWNLVVACDMPAITAGFLGTLLDAAEASQGDCLVPVSPSGLREPLCAAYHRRALPGVTRAIEHGEREMMRLLDGLHPTYWPVSDARWFENLNTPADWAPHEATVATPPASVEAADTRKSPTGEAYPHYIEFRHVDKTFDYPVLVDVNFNVNAGETVAIIGRSGVGKSVTLSHIMGFLKPDSGRIIVAHEDITGYPESELRRIRRKVTMVFQSGALFDSMTIAENILFSLELREDYDEQNKQQVVDGLLRMVDLLEYKDTYPADISTGFKRAVAIARALAAQPECILYDEPTTMVDPIMSDHMANLMLRLKDQLKLTSIVVTHDLDLMRKVADRVVVLHDGGVIFFGPTDELEQSDHPLIQEFLTLDRM